MEIMKILTSREMREIDRKTIEEIGLPGAVLMECAGLRTSEAILDRFPNIAGERIVVVAGKGNNGGDGFVIARRLHDAGAKPLVLLLAAKADLKGDAALNLGIAERVGVEIVEIPTPEAWKANRAKISRATVIVDAIFGTGLTKAAEGLFAAAIEAINKARGFKIAVDIPSGLSSDTFRLIGPAVKADLTVTLVAPKVAHFFPPAEDYVGELVLADIGVPPALLADDRFKLETIEPAAVVSRFGPRKRDAHKGTYGHLLILAGSVGKTGAAIMAAKAAYRSGAGLVTVAAPARCLPVIARSSVELMTEPLAETAAGTIALEALPRVRELLKGKDAIVIGPGISTHPSTAELVCGLIPELKKPAVIDADALNIIAGKPDILRSASAPLVLTPHPGEFARLTGTTNREILDGRLDFAPKFASEFGVILVLKGYRTLVATPTGRVYVNLTGNPGMATGGSGDVLSGLLASLIMQEHDVLGGALAAVYLHGLAGDIAAEKLTERALVAGDLIRFLPAAIKALEAENLRTLAD
jgi:NAD(P)H-hydrate epimerase